MTIGDDFGSATIGYVEEATRALTRPMYTAAEAARWARTTPQTARRWVAGYRYPTTSGP